MYRNVTGDWVWSSDEEDTDEDPDKNKSKKMSKTPKEVNRKNQIFELNFFEEEKSKVLAFSSFLPLNTQSYAFLAFILSHTPFINHQSL